MKIDYTKFFNSPDELAVFCMLDNRTQAEHLSRIATRKTAGQPMSC